VILAWQRGTRILAQKTRRIEVPLDVLLRSLGKKPPHAVPGTAVFLTADPDFAPTALLHNLKHNKVLHERVLFVTVQNVDVPEAGADRRMDVAELAPGIHRVILRYGFMESPNIPRALQDLNEAGVAFDPMQASYFLGRDVLVPATVPKMPWWRHWLFLVLARNSVPATEFFRIPYDRVVELGVRVAI